MQTEPNPSAEAAEPRRRAEERRREQSPETGRARTEADVQRLVHELQVHRIELEMQNEELRKARAEVEALLEKYTDLYDFAPVGYLTLDREGTIREANLTSASLLGIEQPQLLKQRFGHFLSPADLLAFNSFIEQVFTRKTRQSCELQLLVEGRPPVAVRMETLVRASAQEECRVALMNITASRPTAEALREARDRLEERVQERTAEIQVTNSELRLRESEMRTLVEHSKDFIVRLDLEGRHFYVNPATAELYGLEPQNLLGKKLRNLGFPETAWQPARETFDQVVATQCEACVELAHTFGGTKRYFEVRFVPEFVSEGSLTSILAVAREVTERRRAEETLRLRESEVRTLVEHSQDLIVRLDREARHVYANPATAKLHGRSPQELLGKSLRDLGYPEAVWRPAQQTNDKVFATGREATVNMVYLFDHSPRHFDARHVPEFAPDGSVASVLVISREVTERKQAEDRLRKSERLFRASFNSTFQFMGLLHPDGTIIEINNSALRSAGLKLDDIRGLPFWEAHWWTISKQTQTELQQAIAHAAAGESVRYEVDVLGATDQVVTIDFSLRSLPDEGGCARLLIAEGHDLTKRKQAEQRLREAETRARALADAALEGIVIHDHGTIREVNTAAAILFGWRSEEVIGKSVLGFIDPAWHDMVRQGILTRATQHYETVGLKKDGQRFPMEIQSRRFRFRGSRVSVVAVRDLTEQKRNRERIVKLEQEEALKREEAARGSFARQLIEAQEKERQRIATELHDGLGQNLLVIKHHAERALANRMQPKRVADSLSAMAEIATQSVRDIRTIVHDLHPYLLERLGLTRALRAMVESVAKSSSTEFSSDIQNIDRVLSPESEIALYRVFQECLNNLVKHAEATEAHVRIYRQPTCLYALVQDNGRGFELDFALSSGAGRAGLGLKNITERIALVGGAARIVTQPGNGTRVELELPLNV